MHVEHFMTKDPVTCDTDTTLADVAALMEERGVGCVVVLTNGKLAGLVTDRQVCCKGFGRGLGPDARVSEILPEGNPAAVGLDDNIFAVVDTMRSAGVARRVPVITPDATVVGIVSISDIAVIAKDLIDAVLLEEAHNAMDEAKVLTGAKRIVKDIRSPTKTDRQPPGQQTKEVREPTAR